MKTLILSALLLLTASASFAATLNVATFNIRWYGLHESETRDPYLKKFIQSELAGADVIAFEEIVDVNRLRHEVLDDQYKCQSYHNDNPEHQHVVLCYRPELTLSREADLSGNTLDAVALGQYRPAVVGVIRAPGGQPLAHVIAVHLKAQPGFTQVRSQQARIVTDWVRTHTSQLPVILLGDFNTHGDDEKLLSDIFAGAGLRHVDNPFTYTFHSPKFTGRFDHVWLKGAIEPAGAERVPGPCNENDPAEIASYYREISDHCPVAVPLRLATP